MLWFGMTFYGLGLDDSHLGLNIPEACNSDCRYPITNKWERLKRLPDSVSSRTILADAKKPITVFSFMAQDVKMLEIDEQ